MNTAVHCSECGAKMSVKRGNYLYDQETGGVLATLEGVDVCTCPACGSRDAIVPWLPALNRAIVGALVRKRGRLSGPEVRFVRSSLGKSGRELAMLMGARPETVSRWESARGGIGAHPDKLLRLIAAVTIKDYEYGVADVEASSSEKQTTPLRFSVAYEKAGWAISDVSPVPRRQVKAARRKVEGVSPSA